MPDNVRDTAMANGAKENISVSIDISLLYFLDDYCRRHDRKRTEAVTLAIKTLLGIEESKNPDYWERKYNEVDT